MKLAYIGSDLVIREYLSGHSEPVFFETLEQAAADPDQMSGIEVLYLDRSDSAGMLGAHFDSIRTSDALKDVPVVLLLQELARPNPRLLQEGVIDAYARPFDPAVLIERISFVRQMAQSKAEAEDALPEPQPIILSKRIFDLVFACGVILVLSPLLLLVALAIRLESKGPVIYKSKRVGAGYKVFDFLKFRSMYPDADKRLKEFAHLNQYEEDRMEKDPLPVTKESAQDDLVTIPYLIMPDGEVMKESEFIELRNSTARASFFKIANDPRITKVGKFIRNTSIDELPQLFNVIRGDMSIVGNRPLPLYEAEHLTNDDWAERFMAPAGITGLWQVEKRGTSEMSDDERKGLDNTYARNYSLWFDFKIILRTIPALFQKENV